MNKCFILLGITTILMLISGNISEQKHIWGSFLEALNGAIFVISAMTFATTLVFAIYIFIFH